LYIPNYRQLVSSALALHAKIPYIDLIGWDFAIDEAGVPVMIELNQYPDCEFIQIFNGPMFGMYTEELMDAISNGHIEPVTVYKQSFGSDMAHYEYNFVIGKQYSI